MDVQVREGIKSVQLSARVVRADGTIVELGEIATWHRNPLVRAWRRLLLKMRG